MKKKPVIPSAFAPVPSRAADAVMRAAGREPVARVVGAGIASEALMSCVVGAYRSQTARVMGFATHAEVRRLRELVRALEHRVEVLESAADRARPGSGAPETESDG